ncbi:class F sortase [Streptomyces sp. NPDC091289]|uniref:class F sortase n=1 Tax=Streptomyces sp. NPDC091289 TaxID=3365989 RepID=UPI00382AF02A
MTNQSQAGGARQWPRAVLVGIVVLTGVRMIIDSTGGTDGPPRPSAVDTAGSAAGAVTEPSARSLPPSRPTRIRIPEIGVDAPLSGLGREAGHELQVPPPENSNLAGWDRAGVTPGSTGTSVITGHADTSTGPAVFYGLGSLGTGARVSVTRADGRIADFTVYALDAYEKDAFPSEGVYRHTTRAELRLITCGGDYTEKDGYSANTVAYAYLTRVR